MRPGLPLYTLLFSTLDELSIDRDIRLGLSTALDQCVEWDDLVNPPPNPRVTVTEVECESVTIALVHSQITNGRGAACLCLGARIDRSTPRAVTVGTSTKEVHFITEPCNLRLFFRTLPELEDLNNEEYMANAADAFPDLAFVPKLASQFSHFRTKYREARPEVTRHLAVLNDDFQRIFEGYGFKPHETQVALNDLGVNASPESPKVRANAKAMKQRDVEVDVVTIGHRTLNVGTTVRCEWHTKIHATADRIHFHPGKTAIAEGHVLVGIFAEHLLT